jgi:hypothetical protein
VCGLPDATNSGPRPGVALRPSGSIVISKSGTVVSGLDISGTVKITASHVVLRDCRIRPSGGYAAIAVSYTGVANVLISHVEIDGADHTPSVPGIVGAGFTVDAANIHGTGDAIDLGSGDVVINSWIHDLWVAPGDHTDGIQSSSGVGMRVEHNTIDAAVPGVNSAVIIGADLGPVDDVLVAGNLLFGGNYTVYAGSDGRFDSGAITIENNRFSTGSQYGACSFRPSSGRAIDFHGNIWDADGSPVIC